MFSKKQLYTEKYRKYQSMADAMRMAMLSCKDGLEDEPLIDAEGHDCSSYPPYDVPAEEKEYEEALKDASASNNGYAEANSEEVKPEADKKAVSAEPEVTLDVIRKLLIALKPAHGAEVKELLARYGVSKLSALKSESYAAFYSDAQKIGE